MEPKLKIHCSYQKLIPINKIKYHPDNPNKHSEEQIKRLAEIILYQGVRHPVIVSSLSKFVMAGHGRLEAFKLLGLKEVPCDVQKFDDSDQEYAFMTSDNAIASWAELDFKLINNQIQNFSPDFDINLLGLKDFKIDVAEKSDPDSVPDLSPEKVYSKLGDLYEMGSRRVLCGDCTIEENVNKLMNGEKADMVFTDPPYNVASDSKNYAKNVSKSMNDLSEAKWDKNFDIEKPIENLISTCKKDSTFYIWTSHFLIQKIWDILNKYCDFTGYLVWNKQNPMPSLSKRHPTWNTELCAYGTRGSKRVVNFPNEGHFLSCRTVVKKSDGTHPTQKPLELIEPLIDFSSGKNQLIIDTFLGSGSTLIACEKTKRKCFGMELDPHYIDVIIKRYCDYTGQTKVKKNGKEIDFIKEYNGATKA